MVREVEPVKTTALVNINPETDIEVQRFYSEALKLKEVALQRVIATVDDLAPATEDLSIIARVKKGLNSKKAEYLQPLKEYRDQVSYAFDTLLDPILQADTCTREKILAFNREQDRKRKEQEEVNRLRMEAAQKEMALNGELTESVNLVEVSPIAPNTVRTDMGSAGQRDNWKWEVVDKALVPEEYKIINAGMLTPVVKASKGQLTIPGIRIYNEPSIAVRAR